MTTRQTTPDILDNILTAAGAQPAATKLALAAIVNDGGTQMRAGMDAATVTEYEQAIKDFVGWPFPPVIVYHDGAKYWLADGFHRLNAAVRAGLDAIPAEVRAGTRRDAILHAAGANAAHGLRRTNDDKRRAAETLLRDSEWSQWSDRAIAEACGVSPVFVGKLRKELTVNGLQSPTVRTGADGRTINTANIGANRPAVPPAASYGRAEIFEIERVVRELVAEQHTTAGDLRVSAKQRIGRVWQECVRILPAGTPYRDIAQACNNVADQLEQAARREVDPRPSPLAPPSDLHPGAGRTPPPPLTVDEIMEEIGPHLERAMPHRLTDAATGTPNRERQTAEHVLSDFSYRLPDLDEALRRLAGLRQAQPSEAPVVNGDRPLPDWAQDGRKLSEGELTLIVQTWMAGFWRRPWPENPSHTNGTLWQELTAWMKENVTDAWRESDLKFAIKQLHHAAMTQFDGEPELASVEPEPATVAQTVADVVAVYGGAPASAAPTFDPNDDRQWDLRKMEVALDQIIRQVQGIAKQYGDLTGMYGDVLDATRKLELMRLTVRRNLGVND